MALTTQIFSAFPWTKGVNLSVDRGVIAPDELLRADNVQFDTRGSRKKRPGINFDFDSGAHQLTQILTVADVSSSLDGLTFILQDSVGSVAFWIDVGNNGTTIPTEATAADRAVEITTITADMTAEEVAEQVAAAINADAQFTAVFANNNVLAYTFTADALAASSASTSTFTVTGYFSDDAKILNIFDFFWFNESTNQKVQSIVALNDKKILTVYTANGTLTVVPDAGTLWSNDISAVSFASFNNKLIIAVNGLNNKIKRYDPQLTVDPLDDLEGSPVNASIVREHLGRLWYNNKEDLDRIYYTSTFNHTEHNGVGDSGALDISINDGDPKGITAIFPTYKGQLFVAKRTKMYRISGMFPENFAIIPLSNGIGCISNNSIAQIDQDDMFFISERGVHSLAATANFGDFEATFLSLNIQPKFRIGFLEKETITASYFPSLNSYGFTVIDEEISSDFKVMWLYNILLKGWYRWVPSSQLETSLECVTSILVEDVLLPFFGTNKGRIAKNDTPTLNDTDATGEDVAIELVVATGFIFPDGNPYTRKAFKRVGIIYSPAPGSGLDYSFFVDNFDEQAGTIEAASGTATLGEGSDNPLVLNQSRLSGRFNLAPNAVSIEGHGRGFQLIITQAALDQDIEVQGFQVEYDMIGTRQQTAITAGNEAT